ncbi:prosaposin-like isoform X1 [Olea europaea var. sylvestris]|uniref:prosaposin-like isoform X1 n=1 Tax=Olea europaea var. sylvestris TaxID=158386 RepID=UPI000C1CCE1F|nr:prosaposin-like isoform X1 [Olea europaea var. sylvestris]XP_022877871.1 prosaposin-like isoform X1 [Olea europaea var. sylvestris]XP_022877872.1 prosaposin-like isoform X1 [Olea europaea var. sylvestris]
MDTRVLLVLFIVSTCWCCNARELLTANHFNRNDESFSVLQTNNKLSEGESHLVEEVSKNNELCTLCEDFASEALNYLSENKTQTEIISILHKSCSKIPTIKQQCNVLVDYYAPLFFLEVSTIQPDYFCQKVDLCEQAVSISQQLSKNTCDICHHAVTEALLKLKDPDTQIEIIELLLKACNSVEGYAKKCKRLVFEYGPLILVNAEQFLEKNDVCIALHACASTVIGAEQEALARAQHSAS